MVFIFDLEVYFIKPYMSSEKPKNSKVFLKKTSLFLEEPFREWYTKQVCQTIFGLFPGKMEKWSFEMKKRKVNAQQLISFALLALTLVIVLYIGFSDNDIEDLAGALKNLTPAYLLLCLLSWLLYVFFDALAIHHFLRSQGQKIKFLETLHSAIIGIYYCNVTPGASGGQPMQMYCLSKYKVPIGISGSGLAVKFVVFQAVLLITGAVMWLLHAPFVNQRIEGTTWFVLLGYLANFFTIGMVMMMAISQRAVRWVIEKCIRIGVKLRICKDPDASRAKWENHCQSFLGSVQMLMKRPLDVIVQCVIAFLQLMSLMLVILAVYHALGLSGESTSQLITMGVLLYIGASYVPTPGASGAQEGGFASIFRTIFPDAHLFVALLIWRFSTYYLTVLVGAVFTTIENILSLHKANHAEKKAEAEN